MGTNLSSPFFISGFHGRALAEPERYAAAKMALFRAFDECSRNEDLLRVRVSEADIESLLEPLQLDE